MFDFIYFRPCQAIISAVDFCSLLVVRSEFQSFIKNIKFSLVVSAMLEAKLCKWKYHLKRFELRVLCCS